MASRRLIILNRRFWFRTHARSGTPFLVCFFGFFSDVDQEALGGGPSQDRAQGQGWGHLQGGAQGQGGARLQGGAPAQGAAGLRGGAQGRGGPAHRSLSRLSSKTRRRAPATSSRARGSPRTRSMYSKRPCVEYLTCNPGRA